MRKPQQPKKNSKLEGNAATPPAESSSPKLEAENTRREIPGGLPYTLSPGVMKKAFDGIPVAERPSQFTLDFLSTVLGASGGSARPIIPTLKKARFLESDGRPTELYDRFRTQSGRSSAALQGLRNAFEAIFRHNTYAHKLDEPLLKDVIVKITGLPPTDRIVSAIAATFMTIKAYVDDAAEDESQKPLVPYNPEVRPEPINEESRQGPKRDIDPAKSIGLSYSINLVLPETTDPEVFDTIFKSLRDNLLR